VSDTNLDIYGEETRVKFLWQSNESNNFNKKNTVQSFNKQNDLNKFDNFSRYLLEYYNIEEMEQKFFIYFRHV
jgi:hypothetical protein